MAFEPEFEDLRYLNEVGWFLYREKHGYNHHTDSYEAERIVWSQMLLDDFLQFSEVEKNWLKEKVVISLGCGCSGDLSTWPAAVKVGVDPLVNTYKRLNMLVRDKSESQTIYLSIGAEDLPFLDNSADVILCRNALDHMLNPEGALAEMQRVLKSTGYVYLSVDIGGPATPDEPSPFTKSSLMWALKDRFESLAISEGHSAHDQMRDSSVRLLLKKVASNSATPDKQTLLKSYMESLESNR